MKKLILSIAIFSCLQIRAEMPSNMECIAKYNGVTIKMNLGTGAATGVGLALTLGAIGFPPLAFVGLPMILIGTVVMQPIRASYQKSQAALEMALEGKQRNTVYSQFKKLFKKRDRGNMSMLMERQNKLFTDKSKKKWCTHPLYDYLTLKRKIRRGSI